MRGIFLLFLLTALSDAQDSCPSVKIVGVGDSDKLTILRGCPGMHGFPGSKGDIGAPGEKGEKGSLGTPGKMGPTGQKGEKGSSGVKGESGAPGAQGQPGIQGNQGQKGEKGDLSNPKDKAAKNCKDLQDRDVFLTGWYTIYPDGIKPLLVLCDMHTDGGGWIVFQRRVDGSVDYYQDWQAYKTGFGSQLSEFWLGNENVHQLTTTGSYELRIDLEDFNYNKTYAKYSGFKVEGEHNLFRLRLNKFKGGTAGDSLLYHKGYAFTTKDKDNDESKNNCAELYSGAWWYKSCHSSNLNALYLRGEHKMSGKGMQWFTFRGKLYSLKVSEMKFRPEK